MKKTLCIWLVLFLCLCACTGEPDPFTLPSTETTVASTEAPTPSAPTEPEVTEPAPTLPQQPLTEYPQLCFENYLTFIPVSDTCIAIVTSDYAGDGTETRYLYTVDLSDGTQIACQTISCDYCLSFQRVSDGLVLLEDAFHDRYLVLDLQLQELRSIQVPNMTGLFTPDLSQYYYIDIGALTVLDTATGVSSPVSFAEGMHLSYLSGYDPKTNILLFSTYLTPFSYETCNAALDLSTGEFLILSPLDSHQQFTGSGIITEAYTEETGSFDLYYYPYSSDRYLTLPGFLYQDDSSYLFLPGGCSYAFLNCYDDSSFESSAKIYRFAEDWSCSEELSALLPASIDQAFAMSDGSLLCSYYLDGYIRMLLLRPEYFTFEAVEQFENSEQPVICTELKDQYQKILNGAPLPQELADVRAQADAIEQEFGITIFLSNQCAEAAGYCSYPIVTTDQAGWIDEPLYISNALDILRGTLELYPEGFFRQFRNQYRENGLLVLLVEDIQSDNNAIGVSYYIGGWYPIAVDITSFDLMSTYCHELWHATEDFITDDVYDTFSFETWNAMNPEGFFYSYDHTLGYTDSIQWTYFSGWYGTESYFIDSYATVNPKEDRARLMEYLMAYDEYGMELMQAPALYRKAEFMCKAIRRTFDTEGWKNVWWERFHKHIVQ